MADSQLGHTLAGGLHVTGTSLGQAIEARVFACSRPEIVQLVKPAGKGGRLPEFDHSTGVAARLHSVKALDGVADDVTPNVRAERAAATLRRAREVTR